MANWFALIAFGGSPCKHSSYKNHSVYMEAGHVCPVCLSDRKNIFFRHFLIVLVRLIARFV
jgi:hypothetical protein|tara:strand:+ start:1121 stop:1303 length:183 start_codon:yes stop_codon:yes gene_type:complete